MKKENWILYINKFETIILYYITYFWKYLRKLFIGFIVSWKKFQQKKGIFSSFLYSLSDNCLFWYVEYLAKLREQFYEDYIGSFISQKRKVIYNMLLIFSRYIIFIFISGEYNEWSLNDSSAYIEKKIAQKCEMLILINNVIHYSLQQ